VATKAHDEFWSETLDMYPVSGGGGLKGPVATGGAGAATGTGLAMTGFPIIGFTIAAIIVIIVGLILVRMAMVRRATSRGRTT
jgi:hypothetical protein